MVLFKDDGNPRSLAETYFNKRHRHGRSVVENAFGLLKENWREMGKKIDLHITIVPDVFYCCCILHNLTIQQGLVDVEEIMRRIALEAEEEVHSFHHCLCMLHHSPIYLCLYFGQLYYCQIFVNIPKCLGLQMLRVQFDSENK
jgi:hypothetical protein